MIKNMKAAEALCRALEAEGVDMVFGIPGGANLPLYDALYSSSLRHVQARHEQGAGHMAEGYAKASGRLGVALATSGPGATNLVTAIADAMLDSVPVLFITGQIRTDLLGSDGFQEADILGITMPVVKHSVLIQSADEIAPAIHEAAFVARSGRPGPVLVDVPTNILREEVEYLSSPVKELPGYKPTLDPHPRQLQKAADALREARRPILYVGGGVISAEASSEITRLARAGEFPVTCTLMGLGSFPAPDPLWLGMLGMHGTRAANWAMDEADLILAAGARFDDRITGKLDEFAPRAKIVHLDIDPAEISKNIRADIPVVGDAKKSLHYLAQEMEKEGPGELKSWWKKIRDWQAGYPLQYERREDTILPQEAIEEIYRATGGAAIVTSDVGQHQMWVAQFYHFKNPRQWINSGGLGTMGFGLPAALGAKAACKEEEVICVAGDGSLPMVVGEMAIAPIEDLPVKVFLINNETMGMVRQWQEMFWEEHYIGIRTDTYPDWIRLSEAYGWQAERVSDPGELRGAVSRTLACPGPALLDIRVAGDENCWPMIPPGAAARDMIDGT